MLTRKPSAAAPAAYPTGREGDSAIRQLQASPGLGAGPPRSGVGSGPPSPSACRLSGPATLPPQPTCLEPPWKGLSSSGSMSKLFVSLGVAL
ncbi:dual specificity tyrosine-phosphorylation-regulated kinase 2-like [Manis javanica]|uniref:dual specificity tyrosine-phosphorylation-regulated kinase 2-like n=1 Tax=Manis javanica TaxID=9974 RepID=UPI003C6D9E44